MTRPFPMPADGAPVTVEIDPALRALWAEIKAGRSGAASACAEGSSAAPNADTKAAGRDIEPGGIGPERAGGAAFTPVKLRRDGARPLKFNGLELANAGAPGEVRAQLYLDETGAAVLALEALDANGPAGPGALALAMLARDRATFEHALAQALRGLASRADPSLAAQARAALEMILALSLAAAAGAALARPIDA